MAALEALTAVRSSPYLATQFEDMTRSLDAAICTCLPHGVWISPNDLQRGSSKTMQTRQVWNIYMFLLLFCVPWCLMYFDVSCVVIQRAMFLVIALSFPLFWGNVDVSSLFLEPILWSDASRSNFCWMKLNQTLFFICSIWFLRIIDFWGRLTSPKSIRQMKLKLAVLKLVFFSAGVAFSVFSTVGRTTWQGHDKDMTNARTSTWRCYPWWMALVT